MDVFDLAAKITLDKSEYDSGLDEASNKSSRVGELLKNGLGVAAKATVAAIGTATVAIGGLVKSSVDAYANYEQLVGGVETLFKDSADVVKNYANNAFMTAGLSANEYMETVTSFSASLLASLGGDTERAAQVANQAIIDMADNANKMGTSMESIQNAYQGFAKQNYTMLDNLKLGYGGTKTEMERLLADAQKISGIKYNIDSYADVVEAIHVMQEEMGIAGTTAVEASETISGSIGMMKSAWDNLVVGLADDNADMEELIGNFVDSVSTVFENIMPVAEQALYGITDLIDQLLPQVIDEIPNVVNNILPQLLETGVNVVTNILTGIQQNLPLIMDGALQIITLLVNTIITMLPQLIEVSLQIITQLAFGIAQALPTLIPSIVEVVLTIVENLIDNIDLLIDAAIALIFGLAEGLIKSLPLLIEKAPEIVKKLVDALIENAPLILESAFELIVMLVEGIVDNFPQLIQAGIDIIFTIIDGIVQTLGQLVMKGKDIVDSVKSGFSEKVEDAKNWGKDLISNFIGGIKDKWNDLKDSVSSVASTVKSYLGFSEPEKGPLSNFHTYAPDMIDLFTKGIKDNEGKLTAQIERTFDFGDSFTPPSTDVELSSANVGTGTDGKLYELLSEYLPVLANLQIVLDSGELVGAIQEKIDDAFTNSYVLSERSATI